jgi:virginiamycin B lyase
MAPLRRPARPPHPAAAGSHLLAGLALALPLAASETGGPPRPASSSAWLATLPEGETKRWFLLDCTGCHQFNETRVLDATGGRRSVEQWRADIERMLQRFGPDSGFPIVSGHLAPQPLAEWLHAAPASPPAPKPAREPARDATVTELDLPGPDLPHDLAIDRAGRVLVTGMFTDRILVVDPASGAVEPVPIPVPQANPRAIEVDERGDWWVLLGAAQRIARYEPAARRWIAAPVGMYGHSIALGRDGAVWTNDHFARGGLRLARVEPAAEGALSVTERTGPPFRTTARGPSPIPYELRVAPDGRVWASLLHGNELVAHDPATGSYRSFVLPDADAGPRRFDVDAAGILWIPGYTTSKLYRLDPATGAVSSFPLPIPDALPYVVRADPRTGELWIGTAAADAALRFDPRRATFSIYPVPTRGATMRHLAIDPRSGDVWIAYGASPAIHPTRIARISPARVSAPAQPSSR